MSTFSFDFDPLPSLPYNSLTLPNSSSSSSLHENQEINRSASYTSLPGLIDSAPGIKRTYSDNVLSSLAQKPAPVSSSVQNANVELFRRASQKTKKRMSAARFVSPNDVERVERTGRSAEKKDPSPSKSQSKGVGSGALKLFSRKTWLSSSRPNSPSRKEKDKDDAKSQSQRVPSPPKINNPPEPANIAVPEPVVTRPSPRPLPTEDDLSTQRDSMHVRKESSSPTPRSRTVSEYSMDIDSDFSSRRLSRRTSISSIRSRASIDRMYLSIPTAKVPPIPSSVSPDRLSGIGSDANRRRDPHWIPFRSIDADYSTFQSKTSLQKAKIVRTVLLPFLSKTCDRTAMDSLRAEDLDRRTVILNKWWTGLLDLLNGSGQQSISGTDRPAFLEAICEIMFRPEWKMPPFPSSPTDAPVSNRNSDKADSSSSVDSEEPEFLIRTIHQNIRNMFLQNIIQQMAFVVDKLSMRAAPASLVIFGGKTCAYAFFFYPGVADLLARLWHIPPGTLRRVFAEYGPESGRRAGIISQALASSFPPALRSMCFTSYAALSRQLQNKAQIPANTTHIRWHGPWVNRWIGRDSDLFFVFVKHYHLLVAEHVPRHLLSEEKMGVPGLVVVHAQVLLNLESALYRQAGNVAAEHYAPTGDNPDAMAPLPMVIPNATRSIGENRLVMLLRDCIGDRRPEHLAMAEILVGSFQYVLKAAVRKVSMFNNDACFVLCDFLEELLPLISKYQRTHVEEEDWDFWMTVYRQMLRSHTTMTQIRVIAFLYSMWPYLLVSEERKRQIVLDWLLEPRFFAQYFNHWSPMVRHYFYRLLCWRIGRCDGFPTDVDVEIYKRMQQVLNISWAHHQYLTADAEMRDISPPTTNPCSPAPGRMLLIIRTDNHNRPGSFTSFDKLMPSHANQLSSYAHHSSLINKLPDADPQPSTQKKRWSILKTISLFNGPTNSRPGEVTPPGSPDAVAANSRSKQLGVGSEALSRPASPPHQPLTFRFTLEYSNTRPALPAKAKRLPLPTLPHTAQRVLDDTNNLTALTSTERLVARPEVQPLKPKPEELNTARYSGRALTEWSLIVAECRNFFTRRKHEGCPNDRSVETPNIAVETFRMFG